MKHFTPDYYLLQLPDGKYIPLYELLDGNFTHRVCETIEHLVRAGKKPGESRLEALRSAKRSLEMEIERLKRGKKT